MRVAWFHQMVDAGGIRFWMLTNVVGTQEVGRFERVIAQMTVIMFIMCTIV